LRKILAILFLTGCNAVKTTEKTVVKYPDGKIQTIKQVTVKKNKGFELFENYRIENILIREYYHNGNLKFKSKLVHHNGADYPCREALYELKQYDSSGVKRLFIQNECDCHIQKEITYNSKGKILTRWKKEIKRLY
jgi:hypothetical protein